MDRRALLKQLGGAAALAGLGTGCGGRGGTAAPVATRPPWSRAHPRSLAAVKVDPRREIRTVVGLRPFRPSGFRVAVERRDDTVVIHNYGHGGGGITLSWGTAHQAADLAAAVDARQCAVIGCGAVGLATARIMQRRGWGVTIYARDVPPHTTSNIAGGQWSPASVFDRGATTAAFDSQFEQAARLSHRYFQNMVGNRYAVRWIDNYVASDSPQSTDRGALDDLYPDMRVLEPDEHPFGTQHAYRFTTMLVEMPTYLDALTRDFQQAGGRILVREFGDASELSGLPQRLLFNCSGLGARELFGDSELLPIKGQLTVLLPQPEVDYIVIKGHLYMFPRSDGVLLGGTHERGVETLEPDPAAKARILEGHRQLFA